MKVCQHCTFCSLFSRYLLLTTVVLLTIIFSLHGEEKIPLRIMNMPDYKSNKPADMAQVAVLREFCRRNPDIELSSFSGITLSNATGESKLMLAIVGGSAPDVINVNFRMSDTYIQQALLYPLDEYIARDYEDGLKGFIKKTPAPILPVLFRNGPAVKNIAKGKHVWAINNELLVRVMMWRKDFFQEAGLNPERPPETWEELYQCAKAISDPANNRYGISASGGWDFLSFLWSAGGEVVRKNSDDEWEACFGTPQAAVAFDYLMKLNLEKWIDANGNMQRGYTIRSSQEKTNSLDGDPWDNGKLGICFRYLDSRQMGGGTDPALIGIAPVPKGPDGKRGMELNARMDGIFANIVDRKNSQGKLISAELIRDAAWRYIRFLRSTEARRITAQVFVDNGLGRMLSPAWLREFGFTEYLKFFPESFEKMFDEALKEGKPEPYGRNCQLLYAYMGEPFETVYQLDRDNKIPADPSARLKLYQQILKKASDWTTRRMIGKITPQERTMRSRVAIVVGIIIVSIFCFALYKIWQIFSPKDAMTGNRKGWDFKRCYIGYIIMIPALASILLWIYFPMVSGSFYLFQNYRIAGDASWVGLNNLADVLYDPEWWSSIFNTMRYMLLILGFGFIAPIILAVLLQEVSHFKIVYRTLFYLPAVMSGLVVIYMWNLFYQSGSGGIMNQLFAAIFDLFGINFEPIAWLEDANWAMAACVFPTIWAGMGPGCLIYLAALKGIPEDLYEAAEVDGAGFFCKLLNVTLPSIKGLIVINFVGAFISAAQSGGMILVMTFGRAQTEVAELHIFKEAYLKLSFGTAIAMAWILGAVTMIFTIYQLKRLSNMEFKTSGK